MTDKCNIYKWEDHAIKKILPLEERSERELDLLEKILDNTEVFDWEETKHKLFTPEEIADAEKFAEEEFIKLTKGKVVPLPVVDK